METYATPFIKTMIGIAIFLIALGISLAFSSIFVSAIRWW